MVDPKISTSPPPPAEWDLPKGGGQPLDAPDSSFHDDRVGAQAALEQAARLRAAEARGAQEAPRDVLVAKERVGAAAGHRPTQDDAQARALRRHDRDEGQAGSAPGGASTTRGQGGRDLAQLEGTLAAQLGTLAALSELPPDTPHAAARARQAARAEAAARATLRELVAAGLPLYSTPQQTFRRLLARVRRWPRRVGPGVLPESDADFDAWLAWAYAPPPLDP